MMLLRVAFRVAPVPVRNELDKKAGDTNDKNDTKRPASAELRAQWTPAFFNS